MTADITAVVAEVVVHLIQRRGGIVVMMIASRTGCLLQWRAVKGELRENCAVRMVGETIHGFTARRINTLGRREVE